MSNLLSHIKHAANDTALAAQQELRKSALEHGWDKDVANNLHVKYEENKFKVYVHEDYAGDAFKLEFGSETQRPTAVVRKYSTTPTGSGSAFMDSLNKHAGGKR